MTQPATRHVAGVMYDLRLRRDSWTVLVSLCGSLPSVTPEGPTGNQLVLEPPSPEDAAAWATDAVRLVLSVCHVLSLPRTALLVWGDQSSGPAALTLGLTLGQGWVVTCLPDSEAALEPSPAALPGSGVHLVTAPLAPQAEPWRALLRERGAAACDLLEAAGSDEDRRRVSALHVRRMLRHLRRGS